MWKQRALVLLAVLGAALGAVSVAQAQEVPPYLVHQGRLLDALNAPVEGAQSLTFNLYTDETGGASLWTETQTVSVNGGFYNVTLGQVTAIDLSAFSGATLYLGVTINGEELAPRMALRSVPYAFKANTAQNATGDITPSSVTIGDVVIDASGVTVGGNNVIDGSGQWSGTPPTISYSDLQGLPTTLSDLPCADGQVAKRVGGVWACAEDVDTDTDTDTDTTYDAGDGLTLTGTTFGIDGSVQRRAAANAFSCPDGEYLQAIAADGTPTCALDLDTDTTYSAAANSGLTLTGTAFGTDATVQRRTDANAFSCPAGQYLQAASATGAPTCVADADTNTTYAAPAAGGLILSGTDLSIAPSGVTNARLAANAVTTDKILDGTITAADTDTTSVQARVIGTCAVGQYVQAVNANGTVQCGSAPLGESQTNPATSCNALLTARPGLASGVYWLRPTSTPAPFQTFCDMVTDGGGWTLVWSNLRGGRGKLTTEMQWNAAINTVTKVRGQLSTDLESFEVYTGLKHWAPLAPNSLIRYTWSPNYNTAPTQSWRATFTLNAAANYTLTLTGGTQLVGAVTPGITSHSGRPFSAYDVDNDQDAGNNCSALYSETPWWYTACWSGSISGGGEYSETGYFNGAYWTGSAAAWGAAGGTGAGNGWIFVK